MALLRTSRRLPRALACSAAAIVLGAGVSACSSHGAGGTKPPQAETTSASNCTSRWLTLNVSRSEQKGNVSHDVVKVTASHSCVLSGWPVFEKVRHHKGATGATPRYETHTTGKAVAVSLPAGGAAESKITLTVPKDWIWGGGNLCASFLSASLKLPGPSDDFFVLNLPSATVSCGGPAGGAAKVSAGPFVRSATASTRTG